ncbi:MAG: PaaI family thioesterase [Pseudomonadota bacterium]
MPDGVQIGSGAQRLIGYQIDLSESDGSARILLDIEDRHRNRNNSLHGGIISMMLDAAAGFAASRGGPNGSFANVVTVSLTTNYLAAAIGGRVAAIGTYRGGGRSIAYADAVLEDAQGNRLATASGVFKRRGPGG